MGRAMDKDSLFAVPVWREESGLTDVELSDIKNICYKIKEVFPGRNRSNLGGYQSNDLNNTVLSSPPFLSLLKKIKKGCDFITRDLPITTGHLELGNMWVNFNEKNNYNAVHFHPISPISGVVYISGESVTSCGLYFCNPHPAEAYIFSELQSVPTTLSSLQIKLTPKVGDMIFFPGWLPHGVPEYSGNDERISIAFNLKLVRH